MVSRVITLDDNLSLNQLWKDWQAGDEDKVVLALSADHAGLTATFIAYCLIDPYDVKRLARRLGDIRNKLCRG
jgi:hypothetical protein